MSRVECVRGRVLQKGVTSVTSVTSCRKVMLGHCKKFGF